MSVRSLASALLSVIALSAISCISTGAPPEFEAREHRVVGNEANTQGDRDLAISEYTRALELDPTAHDYSERAYAHAGLGNVEAAITDYTDAIALDDQSGLAYSQRALLYNELGRWEEAVADLDRAIELRPERADQYNGRGFANLNLGNWQQVVEDMDAALELAPSDDPLVPIYLGNRSSAYAELGELALALVDLDRSLALDPNNVTSQQNRLVLLVKIGQVDRARADAEVFLGDPGAAAVHLFMSDLFRSAGLLEEAVLEIELAIELDPESPVLHIALGFTHAQRGDLEQATAAYEAARDLTSDPELLAEIESALDELDGD